MTLILSCLTSSFVAQVADRRLVWTDGRVADDEACKALLYCGHFLVAYTGLATIGGQPTDRWLAAILASRRGLPDATQSLAVEGERALARTRLQRSSKRLAVCFAGWARPSPQGDLEPLYAVVSNFAADGGGWLSEARDNFTISSRYVRPGELVVATGGIRLTDLEWRGLMRELRKRLRRPQSTGGTAVQIMTGVARGVAGRRGGEAVGKSVLRSVLPRGSVPAVVTIAAGPPDYRNPTFEYDSAGKRESRLYAPGSACGGLAIAAPYVAFGRGADVLP
jgi:hypothetical protein